jgi:phage shock protein C
MNGRFLLNKRNGKIMGVAAGLGDYTGVDPLIIRVALVGGTLLTGPIALIVYVLVGWLVPGR